MILLYHNTLTARRQFHSYMLHCTVQLRRNLPFKNCLQFAYIVVAFKYTGNIYATHCDKINFTAVNKCQTIGGINISSLIETIGKLVFEEVTIKSVCI